MGEPFNAIQAVGLTKTYGKTVAIDNVSFSVPKGEVVGVLGPSGSGKTTLVGLFSGIVKPSRGKALVAGVDASKMPSAVRRKVGVVSDLVQVYDDLSVEKNLVLYARLFGLNSSAAKEKADEVVSLLELESSRKTACKKLSSGVRKKVLIGSAIINEPEILLFDEPTAGLDLHDSLIVRNYVSSVSHSGRTVLWATNSLSEAERICRRMIILASGKVIADDEPKRFTRGIAGTGSVEIRVSGIKAENIADIFGSIDVSWEVSDEGEVRLTVDNEREALDRIFTLIGRMGASIVSIGGKVPTLEDAYLQVTGEARK
ncbi:MAG: ABC transporter ATP-binding protein [Candidatus Brockarchaeota archaeon]|nr:ABC transporter ATP-binding protein [Candidatus Brockarchaeota archaeon]